MADSDLTGKRDFSDLIGKLGVAWGLPSDACRVHALLYINPRGTPKKEIGVALGLSDKDVDAALAFLVDYQLAWSHQDGIYKVHADPWEAMMKGLEQRRNRDLPAMRKSLQACRRALDSGETAEALQMGRMIKLVDDLSAIQAQAFKVSPGLLRSVVGLSGRAARLFGR